MDAPLNLEAMTHRVHPDQSLPVLGVADVNQSVQFTWPDAVGNKLNICQSINDTPFLCTQDHSTEVSVDNVWTKTFELRYQLQITKEQQQFTLEIYSEMEIATAAAAATTVFVQ